MPLTADDRRVWFQRHARPGFKDWETYAADLERRIEDLVARMRARSAQLNHPLKLHLQSSAGGTVDFRKAYKIRMTLTASLTSLSVIPPDLKPDQGAQCFLEVVQGGVGSYTIGSYSPNVVWPGGTAPTLSTTVGYVDALAFFADGSDGKMRGMYTLGFQS